VADRHEAATALAAAKPQPRTHWFTWRYLRCKVTETPDYLASGQTLLELHLIAARDTPCPLTGTGYRSHFIDADELAAAGGVPEYLTAWMDREARTKTYRDAEYRWRQGDLRDLLELADEERQS
jgi:hypothetical protein